MYQATKYYLAAITFFSGLAATANCIADQHELSSGTSEIRADQISEGHDLSQNHRIRVNTRRSDGNNADTTSERNRARNNRESDSDRTSESDPTAVVLDGYANNQSNPEQGTAGTPYIRIAPAAYADGIAAMSSAADLRYISNRIFADGGQNLFSPNGITQWVYNWGQFLDHSIGLREGGSEIVEVLFDESDPLEFFTNSAENLRMTRSAAAAGTGETSPREQLNTVSSYIDAWAVYGGSESRLEWLREGPFDGDMSNNGAHLLLTDQGYLPTAGQRGDIDSAPAMELAGRLHAVADLADELIIAGDIRANENIALTAVQTLFAREHNRLVDALPDSLSDTEKFAIARQVVIATQQYITYNEFLPAVGLQLDAAKGYQTNVNASISNEFATVGYRAHSMIHGEIELEASIDSFTATELEQLQADGIEIEATGNQLELAVPLNVAFANPQLLVRLGLGPVAAGLGGEPQYKNDEQIDNQLRSVLFQLPNPDVLDPDACLDGPQLNECFLLANDLGALDVFRARDHGISDYNSLREAYGLARVTSFTDITGESTEEFPDNDPMIDQQDPINDPDIMNFTALFDANGNPIELDSDSAETDAIHAIRQSTLAARLKAIYQNVDNIDAFVGMVSEPALPASDLGELQYAMWKQQFEALRDGDANFYLWNRRLQRIVQNHADTGIDYQQTLADIIVNNTDLDRQDIQANMFFTAL